VQIDQGSCGTDPLPGRWYKVMADNYYNTLELAVHMRDNRQMLVGGTM
jgi:hypothetical protein